MAQSQRKKVATKQNNLKPFYVALVVIALAGVGWIAYSLAGGGGKAATAPIDLEGIDNAQTLIARAQGVSAGAADAPVKVLVFSDFTCPACRVWATQVEPKLRAEFVETGKVDLVYHDFPLGGSGEHANGFIAARAARCAADQNKFWEYHDMLFAHQAEWAYGRGAPIDLLVNYSTQVGMDGDRFERCLNSDEHADVVSANRILGENLGVGGTPTVFIGSRSVAEWSDYSAVKAAVQRQLGS